MVHTILLACGERNRRAHNDRARQAWNTAMLPHQKRPSINSILIPETAKRAQTWKDMMHTARMITFAYGGTA
jgi:hypothetical protein